MYIYILAESNENVEGHQGCNNTSSTSSANTINNTLNMDLDDIWGHLDVAKDLEGAAEEPPTPAEGPDGKGDNIEDDNERAAGGGRGDFDRRWERLVSSEPDRRESESDPAGDDTSPRGDSGGSRGNNN